MRDVDCNEEVRGIVGRCGITVEWLHTGARRAAGKDTTQEIDQEGQAEAFGSAGR